MRRWLTVALTCLLPLVLLGCGGGSSGGSSGSTGNGTVSATGKFVLAYSGGTIPGVKHAWVTVTKVVLHEDLNKTWVQGDTSWKVVTLGMPVTIDLAAASGFIVGSQDAGVSIPVGTYNQIRLILADHDPAELEDSARAKGLAYNAQVEYDNGAIVPIELPSLLTGFRLDRGVQITSSSGSTAVVGGLAAHIDLDRNLVRFDSGYEDASASVDAVTLRMRSYSTRSGSDVGAIFGQIDPTMLCGSPVVPPSTACASDVSVSLYQRSLDGLFARMTNLYTVKIDPSVLTETGIEGYGIFFMSPLVLETEDDQTYDLIIRGRGMRTMVIQDVPLNSILGGSAGVGYIGTYVGKTWDVSGGTYRSYIRPELIDVSDVESSATISASQSPINSRMVLGLRLASRSTAGSPLPYELVSGNTDPFTGLLRSPLPLPKGRPLVASYQAILDEVHTFAGSEPIFGPGAASPTFMYETPSDGSGVFVPMALGRYYDDGAVVTSAPVTDAATTFAPVPLVYKTGVVTKTVTVSATGLPEKSTLDRADLVVSDVGGIVHTESVLIPMSGTTLPAITVRLPDGVQSNGYATGVYSFAIRTRASGSTTPAGVAWHRGTTQLDLRTGSTTTITIP
jgi:hypothetical protein